MNGEKNEKYDPMPYSPFSMPIIPVANESMNEALMQRFVELIATYTGLQIRTQDRGALAQKIAQRMKVLRGSASEKYYHFLELDASQNRHEWRELILLLTTTESYFLRDKGQFNLLENVIFPQLIEEKNCLYQTTGQPRSLRLWSAGCSTGEEPYSLAILVQELIPDWQQWNILILGTDINEDALEKAKKGLYSSWSFRLVNPDLQTHYFYPKKTEWQIKEDLRQLVTFRPGNLVKDHYPNLTEEIYNIDLILCRNVFVYFESKYIGQVLKKFYQTLRPGGYLITGHAELHGQALDKFQAELFPESIIYRRSELDLVENPLPSQKGSASLIKNWAVLPPEQLALESNPFRLISSLSPSQLPQTSLDSLPPQEAVVKPLDNIPQPWVRSPGSPEPEHKPHTPSVPAPISVEEIPQLVFKAVLREAQACFQKKDYAEAVKKAEQVIELNPDNFEAYYLLAQIYANLGQYPQAIHHCQQASKVDAMSAFPDYLLAHIAEEQGDLEAAKSFLRRVIYLCPSFTSAYLQLGNIYDREGNIKRAKKMYAASCEILKSLPPNAPLEQNGKMTAGEMLAQVRERLLKLSVS